jgi:ubiquinone/menaquinone biosynthesis C-methylase UbiE
MPDQESHWGSVYKSKSPMQVSWYQPHLKKSLELIAKAGVSKDASIIDVGGGASTLADDLIAQGFANISVLDISAESLEASKKRLGKTAQEINWIVSDITDAQLPKSHFELWHDRAVFHFLTDDKDKHKYKRILLDTLKPQAFVIIATFSLTGPMKCSDLEVARYSSETLSQELGNHFKLIEHLEESHKTPLGAAQNFTYCLFRRR